MIATSAGIASNELTALRRMAISQPNAPPSVRGLTCLAAHCRRGARTQDRLDACPAIVAFATLFLVSPLTSPGPRVTLRMY